MTLRLFPARACARLLLYTASLAVMLAGCAPQPIPMPPTSTARPVATATIPATPTLPAPTATKQPVRTILIEPEALRGVRVEFWHPWTGEAGEAIDQSVGAFNQENQFGIRVESISQGNYDDLLTQVGTALESGNPPGLAAAPIHNIVAWQAEKQAVVDLQPYVEDARWGLSQEDQADFYPLFWQQDLTGDQRLGVPAQRSGQVLVYNTSLAGELGFGEPPGTPEEFERQACAAAQSNRFDDDPQNDTTGGWAINTSPSAFLPWLYSFGAEVLSPSGDGYRFNTPETGRALSFLKELYDAGCAWEPPTEYAGPQFAGRQALFITASMSDLPDISSELKRAGNPDRWTVIPFPSPVRQPAVGTYGPSFFLFEKTPKEQLAAWLLLKWLTSPEQQAGFIEAGNTFPTRASALASLDRYAAGNPQWAAAQPLLEYARIEPSYPSWDTVRWVVGDVGTQVFRYYFTPDRIPATLKLMDETAAELHARSEN